MKYELININLEQKMDQTLHYVSKNILLSGHNSKPVLLHSFKVGLSLYLNKYHDNIIISGILHDLIEDTDITKKDIEKEFNKDIANIVAAVSFDDTILDKYEQARLMFQKCYNYGFDALIVKCADLLDNVNYINLADNPKELLKKYQLFLDLSLDKIGHEKIYQDLLNKVNGYK